MLRKNALGVHHVTVGSNKMIRGKTLSDVGLRCHVVMGAESTRLRQWLVWKTWPEEPHRAGSWATAGVSCVPGTSSLGASAQIPERIPVDLQSEKDVLSLSNFLKYL